MQEIKKYICYPDNNIIIDHEKGKKILPISDKIKYVYSYVHLEELQEAGENLEKIKTARFMTIEEITDRSYVENENGTPVICVMKPSDKFCVIESPIYKQSSRILHLIANRWIVDENPRYLMQKLDIEKKKINNYTPKQIIEKYGEFISCIVTRTCLIEQQAFQTIFNVLDALGFWQDVVQAGSTMNRIYDANHAYFATACDYFITDDKKTRNKANVVYQILGYKTKAISFLDFKKIVDL